MRNAAGAERDQIPTAREIVNKWRIPIREVKGLQKTLKNRARALPGEAVKTKNERIGKGHFGEVLKAEWKGEAVVVKTVRSSIEDAKRIRDMRNDLENEVFVLTSIEGHRNIVELRGLVFEEDPYFLGIILKYCDGGSMKSVFKDRSLTLRQRCIILHGIACGIAHLHREGIEHRDLWPANILMDADLVPKVADYGLAITRFSVSISNKCQFRWSSPERCRNHVLKKPRWEVKNDVWSFGMIAYWVLTSQRPYSDVKGSVRTEIENGVCPTWPSLMELPSNVTDVIDTCWIYNTNDRSAAHLSRRFPTDSYTNRPPMREVADRLLLCLRAEGLKGIEHCELLSNVYPDNHQTRDVDSPRSVRRSSSANALSSSATVSKPVQLLQSHSLPSGSRLRGAESDGEIDVQNGIIRTTGVNESGGIVLVGQEERKPQLKERLASFSKSLFGRGSKRGTPTSNRSPAASGNTTPVKLEKNDSGDTSLCVTCHVGKVAAIVKQNGIRMRLCRQCTTDLQRAAREAGGSSYPSSPVVPRRKGVTAAAAAAAAASGTSAATSITATAATAASGASNIVAIDAVHSDSSSDGSSGESEHHSEAAHSSSRFSSSSTSDEERATAETLKRSAGDNDAVGSEQAGVSTGSDAHVRPLQIPAQFIDSMSSSSSEQRDSLADFQLSSGRRRRVKKKVRTPRSGGGGGRHHRSRSPRSEDSDWDDDEHERRRSRRGAKLSPKAGSGKSRRSRKHRVRKKEPKLEVLTSYPRSKKANEFANSPTGSPAGSALKIGSVRPSLPRDHEGLVSPRSDSSTLKDAPSTVTLGGGKGTLRKLDFDAEVEEGKVEKASRAIHRPREPEDYFVALRAIEARHRGELSISVGETVMVTERRDNWWKAVKTTHKKGWFPAVHIRPASATERFEFDEALSALKARRYGVPSHLIATPLKEEAADDSVGDVGHLLPEKVLPEHIVKLNKRRSDASVPAVTGTDRDASLIESSSPQRLIWLNILPPQPRHRRPHSATSEALKDARQKQRKAIKSFAVSVNTSADELIAAVRSKFMLPVHAAVDIAVLQSPLAEGEENASGSEEQRLSHFMSDSTESPYAQHKTLVAVGVPFSYETRFRERHPSLLRNAAAAADETNDEQHQEERESATQQPERSEHSDDAESSHSSESEVAIAAAAESSTGARSAHETSSSSAPTSKSNDSEQAATEEEAATEAHAPPIVSDTSSNATPEKAVIAEAPTPQWRKVVKREDEPETETELESEELGSADQQHPATPPCTPRSPREPVSSSSGDSGAVAGERDEKGLPEQEGIVNTSAVDDGGAVNDSISTEEEEFDVQSSSSSSRTASASEEQKVNEPVAGAATQLADFEMSPASEQSAQAAATGSNSFGEDHRPAEHSKNSSEEDLEPDSSSYSDTDDSSVVDARDAEQSSSSSAAVDGEKKMSSVVEKSDTVDEVPRADDDEEGSEELQSDGQEPQHSEEQVVGSSQEQHENSSDKEKGPESQEQLSVTTESDISSSNNASSGNEDVAVESTTPNQRLSGSFSKKEGEVGEFDSESAESDSLDVN